MDKPHTHHKNSRHMPAFVLLFLNEEHSNGAGLLNRMLSELPHCHADSAGLYRSLQALETEGSVESGWETQASGSPRKVYTITEKGRRELDAFAQDIRDREENLRFFLKRYSSKGES